GLRDNRRGGPRGDGPPEEAPRRLEGAADEVVTTGASASRPGRHDPVPTVRRPRGSGLRPGSAQSCGPARSAGDDSPCLGPRYVAPAAIPQRYPSGGPIPGSPFRCSRPGTDPEGLRPWVAAPDNPRNARGSRRI